MLCGDALEELRTLPDGSVHCALTSPPFFGLRDYGMDGQIGLEATPDEWVARLVAVFREVRRVLRDDGTLWVECGDGYAQGHGGSSTEGTGSTMRKAARGDEASSLTCSFCGWLAPSYSALVEHHATTSGHKAGDSNNALVYNRKRGVRNVMPGYKPKDLLGQPWLLAFALRADGWYLRQCIIWAKPNAMPESVRDRCTTAHSYVFLFSKRPRYFFDAESIAEPAEWARWGDQTVPKYEGTDTASGWMQPKGKNELLTDVAGKNTARRQVGFNERWDQAEANGTAPTSKNARSVWQIPTSGFSGAHFATWPPALVERIIRAGTSERGVCPECGAGWVREVEAVPDGRKWTGQRADANDGFVRGYTPGVATSNVTLGWKPSCEHRESFKGIDGDELLPHHPVPATVLDPFMGSGTTALVARKLGRRSIGVELNESYCSMAARRLSQLSLLAQETA